MADIKRFEAQSQGPVRPAAYSRARTDTHDTYAYARTKRIGLNQEMQNHSLELAVTNACAGANLVLGHFKKIKRSGQHIWAHSDFRASTNNASESKSSSEFPI